MTDIQEDIDHGSLNYQIDTSTLGTKFPCQDKLTFFEELKEYWYGSLQKVGVMLGTHNGLFVCECVHLRRQSQELTN